MDLQVGVKVLLRNQEGAVLLLKRSEEIYKDINNHWDIPGGRINTGISLMENLEREVMEETGLSLASVPVLCGAQDILKTDKHVVRLTYTALAEGVVRLSEEHTEYRWLPASELSTFPKLDRYVRKLAEEGRLGLE